MMTRNDAVALQLFCVMMTFSDALPVLSTKNDGHCHHSRMARLLSHNNRLARETTPPRCHVWISYSKTISVLGFNTWPCNNRLIHYFAAASCQKQCNKFDRFCS